MGKLGKQKPQKTMITTTVTFDHRGRARNGAEGHVEIRVTKDRKNIYIDTGVRVYRNQWSFDKVVNHPLSYELNDRISILVSTVMTKINERLRNGQDVDIAKLKRDVWVGDVKRDFLDWISDEIEKLDISPGTHKHYCTLKKRLNEFAEITSFRDVNVENIKAFDMFLRTLTYNALPLSEAGRHNYHKNLRHLLQRAAVAGKIDTNPYTQLRGAFKRGEKENLEYLTDEEVDKILELHPLRGSMMDQARDLFIFQLYTGLSYADAQAFDFKQYKLIDGTWRMTGTRIKTGEPFVNQLLPPAVQVLEKYNWSVPQIINAVYNRELKDIGVAAGIHTRMHSHLARHTFATFMLKHGVAIENLSKMLGHSNIKMTQRYAKVLAESVHEDFERISQLIKNKKI